jgi:hypothetical protein
MNKEDKYRKIKKFEIYGSAPRQKSVKLCEVEAKTIAEAIRKGTNFSRLMNKDFLLAKEVL